MVRLAHIHFPFQFKCPTPNVHRPTSLHAWPCNDGILHTHTTKQNQVQFVVYYSAADTEHLVDTIFLMMKHWRQKGDFLIDTSVSVQMLCRWLSVVKQMRGSVILKGDLSLVIYRVSCCTSARMNRLADAIVCLHCNPRIELRRISQWQKEDVVSNKHNSLQQTWRKEKKNTNYLITTWLISLTFKLSLFNCCLFFHYIRVVCS